MMDERIFKMLDQEVHPEEVEKLKKKCVDLVGRSRHKMQDKYDKWDKANQTYMGEVDEDSEDKKAKEKKEPPKMVVPITFSQTQSFAAFSFLLFTQNRTFYELKGSGPEDYAHDAENYLERDLAKNKWNSLMYQCLIDVPRFGMCVTDVMWQEDYAYLPTQRTIPPANFLGIQFRGKRIEWDYTKVLRYKGNQVRVVSPYNFFPDTRVPLRDLQEGEFVAVDEEMGDSQLEKLQKEKEVAGYKHARPLMQGYLNAENYKPRFTSLVPDGGNGIRPTPEVKLVTKIQIDVNPKELGIGTHDCPIRYWVWIANNQRIIKLEPMGYLHSRFTVNVAEFTPDQHVEVGRGLAGVIDYLQSTLTWFINSHIASVRRTIDSKFIYDPAGIDTKSLEARSPYIALNKNVSRSGVDRWIKQFQVVDATQNHMTDADNLNKLVQMVTGINDNAQGQYNSGRRSATESRAVIAGASSRLRMHDGLIWTDCFGPTGQLMLANGRQGMDQQLWLNVMGEPPQDSMDQQKYFERFMRFKGTPEDILRMDDFLVYDGTLPSEKGFIAQSMQELLAAAFSNPETAFALNLNLGKLMEESFRLRGIDNIERFRMTPEETMQMYARLRAANSAGGTTPDQGTGQQPVLPE